MTSHALIQVENLYKLFGSSPEEHMHLVQAGHSKEQILADTGHTLGLKNINLSINKGEIFVIMGLSGSGKSTLIRHFNRLIDPTAGAIKVEGTDVTQLDSKQLEQFRRHKMSMVFQRFGLLPHKTVLENVAYGLRIQGIDKHMANGKAFHWLETVGLKGYEKQYPSQLSGGQQQRVGLARALCTDAEILLMDEAFSALDPLIRSEMQEQLIELQQKLHKTIIFITHDLDEALRLGDRIAILKDGEIVQQGTPEEILLQPSTDYVKAFVSDVNRARALTVKSVMDKTFPIIRAQTADKAIQHMHDENYNYGFVTSDDVYQGALSKASLQQATKHHGEASLSQYYEHSVSLNENSILETVISKTLEADHPLPVTNDQGRLIGQLSRNTIAKALSYVE